MLKIFNPIKQGRNKWLQPIAYLGLIFSMFFSACTWLGHQDSSPESVMTQQVLSTLNSIVSSVKSFDSITLGSFISQDYTDSQGRSRLQLLDALRQDHERFASVEISVFSVYSQIQQGTALLRFDFTQRSTPKQGAELKFKGKAQWTLEHEPGSGQFKLLRAEGDTFVGIRP
jgi:hypothetical protein